jgi:hypothetical protein
MSEPVALHTSQNALPPATPWCDKMVKVAPESQKIGNFLEWLAEQGVALCTYTPGTYSESDDGWWLDHVSIERRLAKYFDIDLNKVEDERRALLEHIRSNT